MKKKLLLILVSIFMITSCAIGVVACGFGTDAHKHTYSEEWTHDEIYHWHAATCEHKDEVSGKASHTWDSVVKKEPTCANEGERIYTCTVCKAIKTEEIPAIGHSFVDEWTKDETYHWHKCNDCDEISGKAEHSWNSGIVTIEPTCAAVGEKTHTCRVCEATKTEEIATTAHTFSDDWETDEIYHWHKCNDCDEISGKAEHIWVNDICTVCLTRKVSVGLKYELSSNEKYYSVVGIGTCTDKDIVIPSKYNNLPVTTIGYKAFSDCTALESIEIPDSVTCIESSAFNRCTALKSIEIPNGVTSIEKATFYKCSSLTSVSIPDSVTSIGGLAFSDCTALTNIEIPDNVTSIGGFSGCTALTYIEIPDGVTTIGDSTFYNCSSLTNIEIPDSVGSIGNSAFAYCNALTSIEIPGGITSIEFMTFAGCDVLASIEIPKSVTCIEYSAFANCTLLANIEIPKGVTSIEYAAFYNCGSLTSIIIPDKVTSMGSGVFYNCDALTIYCEAKSVPSGWDSNWNKNFPDGSVVWDCNNNEIANDGCIYTVIDGIRYRLKDGIASVVQQPKNISGNKVILKNISYKDNSYIVTTIEDSSFSSCDLLEDIEIPDSVMSIGEAAFAGCSLLVSVTIPDGVKSIEDLAFKNCSSLTNIEIPDSVMSIGGHAFVGCNSLTSIKIPNGITSIGIYTFNDCLSLTSIEIPDSIISINIGAFSNCPALAIVYYGGTENEWSDISIGSSNSVLTEVDIYYYSETEPTDIGNYWHYAADGKTPVIWSKEAVNLNL